MTMRYSFFVAAFFFAFAAGAQNTTSSWTLAGNSNASAASRLGTTNAVPLNLVTNNATRLTVYANGRVGVGANTTNANATRVLNLADANAVLRILRVHPTNAPAVELISRTSADGANVAYWDMYAEPTDASFRVRDRVTGANRDRLTISNSGNVGIGTTAPTFLLEVENAMPAGRIISAVSTYKGTTGENTAVYGSSLNAPGYGYGVRGLGGNTGVYGEAQGGNAAGGAFGVSGDGRADAGAGPSYGLYGRAFGGRAAYGVYGYAASGDLTNAAGYFDGIVYANNYFTLSDRKFKKDITPVENALSQILKLKPSTYRFNTEQYKGMALPKERQMGFVADEVGRVFPELVNKAVKPARYDEKDRAKLIDPEVEYEAVNYQGLIPVLVASTQEQQQQIESLKQENAELKERLAAIEATLAKNNSVVSASAAYLASPVPNPSNGSALIRYNLPDGVGSARLTLLNAKGQSLKEINLTGNGAGQVSLGTASLPAGLYTYSLWINGRQTASKQLVVVR